MTDDPRYPEQKGAIQTKLDLVRKIADIKRQATTERSDRGPQATRTLTDEDITVFNVTLRVPSSQLLGNVPAGSGRALASVPDLIMIDSDSTDMPQCDHDVPIP